MKSRLTTLCYIERDNHYLMLHRVSKKNDVNKDQWIGVGGQEQHPESQSLGRRFLNCIYPKEFLMIREAMKPEFCAEGVWVKEIMDAL